jgi:hypothetical protein
MSGRGGTGRGLGWLLRRSARCAGRDVLGYPEPGGAEYQGGLKGVASVSCIDSDTTSEYLGVGSVSCIDTDTTSEYLGVGGVLARLVQDGDAHLPARKDCPGKPTDEISMPDISVGWLKRRAISINLDRAARAPARLHDKARQWQCPDLR